MRLRLALFLFFILASIATSTTLLDNYFVNARRMDYVDAELSEVIHELESVDLIGLGKLENLQAEGVITSKLGIDRIGKFFVIRDPANRILFESAALKLIGEKQIPFDVPHLSKRFDGKLVRVLNVQVQGGVKIQAAVIVDEHLLVHPTLSLLDVGEILGLTLLGMLFSLALARKLLAPMRRLSDQLASRAQVSSAASRLPLIEHSALATRPDSEHTRDEFHQIVLGLNSLITRVNSGYEVLRVWSYQMA
ncbi:MAG: HAMP domain-containing protein, partial [Proteobacteria bacterium]